MAKVHDPERYANVPGWVRVVDDFGNQRGYHHIEDVRWMFKREVTPQEKETIDITLEWLEQRVYHDEDTGCWVWGGFITKQGQPQARFSLGPHISATMLVRRLVAKMKFEPSFAFPNAARWMQNRQAGVGETCLRGCCHPDHVRMRTKQQAMKNRRGIPLPLTHKMRISATRLKRSKVSDEVIQQILADPRPGNVVALELGVDKSYVPHVRTGKLRTYSTMGRNMFSGLMT